MKSSNIVSKREKGYLQQSVFRIGNLFPQKS